MRIKGVKIVTVRRGGKLYTYYRHRATNTRIKAEYGTAGFAAEVAWLDARAKAKEPLPGTWGALVTLYRKSPDWTEHLKPRTRKDYDRVFTYLRPIDDMPLSDMHTGFVYDLRDQAFAKHKRRFSTYVVQVVRLVLEWGKRRKIVSENGAIGVRAVRRPKDAPKKNRAWADAERETVLSESPKQLLVPIALGMFAGLREGDAILLPWSAYIKSVVESRAAKTGEPLWVPAHFRLRAILETAPKVSTIMAVNLKGQPWTENGFRASFFKFLGKLERSGKIGKGLTYHGLRHTVGKLIIDAGGTTRDVQAILGHRSEAASEHYSREADQHKRASATIKRMERIERGKMDKQADAGGQTKKRKRLSH